MRVGGTLIRGVGEDASVAVGQLLVVMPFVVVEDHLEMPDSMALVLIVRIEPRRRVSVPDALDVDVCRRRSVLPIALMYPCGDDVGAILALVIVERDVALE